MCSSSKSPLLVLTTFFILLLNYCCYADVLVINKEDNQTIKVFIDFELTFAIPVPDDGIEGLAVLANPEEACVQIERPPWPNNGTNFFALIKRRSCALEEKVRYAQLAGYAGAIIYNVDQSKTHHGEDSELPKNKDITIPAILIGHDDGSKIVHEYLYNKGYKLVINPETSFNLSNYLLPFVVVIGVCFLIMFLFMIIKCIKDRRRNRRNRLSSRHLKHLEVKKFKTGDKYEVCAICLEDYCEGEKLRILPCSHAYHTKCIDPWLTNNRRNCPICKRKVAIEGVTFESDSESDSETTTPTERTPLLRSGSNTERQPLIGSTTNNDLPSTYGANGGTENEPSTSYQGPLSLGGFLPVRSRSADDLTIPAEPVSRFSRFKNSLSQVATSTTRAILHRNSNQNNNAVVVAAATQPQPQRQSPIASSSGSYGSVSSLVAPCSSHSINFEETIERAEAVECEDATASSSASLDAAASIEAAEVRVIAEEMKKNNKRRNQLLV